MSNRCPRCGGEGWVSVEEGLPDDFVDVLAYFPGGECRYDVATYSRSGRMWGLPNSGFAEPDADPTHWMPLPAPPGGSDG